MKVIVAETAGFCRGVRDALEKTLNARRETPKDETIYTFGPLIHNHQVLSMLAEKGIREVNQLEDCAGRKVIIRAHGIPPNQRNQLKTMQTDIVDATCKRVARVQAVIKRHTRQGFETIIVGDEDHAEVVGLLGFTDGHGHVIQQPEQLGRLRSDWEKVLLVAQTTQNQESFGAIEQRFHERYPQGEVIHTICGATNERQAEVRKLCSQVDAMVIVGGYHSGNTIRLAELARACLVPTYHIETERELDPAQMSRYRTVGVSAGASTPNWMIRNVVRCLESTQPNRSDQRDTRVLLDRLAYSNASAALAAALLVPILAVLFNLPTTFGDALMAGCYVFAMHVLNRYLDQESMQLNDPERAAFYKRRQPVFVSLSLLALAISLWAAAHQGLSTLVMLAVLALWGALYNVPILQPLWPQRFLSVLKIKDIPTSKTLAVPLAWAAVTAFIPQLPSIGHAPGRVLLAFLFVFLLILVRTALLDFRDIHGDRLVGRETIVVYWGEQKTVRMIRCSIATLAGSLVALHWLGIASPFAYFVLPVVITYGVLLERLQRNRFKGTPAVEILTDSILVAVGLLAVVRQLLA